MLGGWGNPRSWPWWLAALAVALSPDRPTPTHPLGRWAAPLAVVSLVGVWAAVPDTEPPLAVGVALAPLAALRLWRGPAVGPAGTGVLVVAVLGSTWVGSAGGAPHSPRLPRSVWSLVAPLVMGFGATLRGQHLVLLAGAHTVVALAVPRVIMDQTVPVAVAIALGRARAAGPAGRTRGASGAVGVGGGLTEPVDRRREARCAGRPARCRGTAPAGGRWRPASAARRRPAVAVCSTCDRVAEQLLEQRDDLEQVGAGPERQVHRVGAGHLPGDGVGDDRADRVDVGEVAATGCRRRAPAAARPPARPSTNAGTTAA